MELKEASRFCLSTDVKTPKIYLVPELFTEILARVPVRSLLRLRCVSKSWCSIIGDRYFAFMHLELYHKGRHNTRVLTMERTFSDWEIQTLSVHEVTDYISLEKSICLISKDHERLNFRVLDYGNGVLLLRPKSALGFRGLELELWNPLTRKSLKLPPRDAYNDFFGDYSFVVGFGLDSMSKDIKVMAYSYRSHSTVEIYSLRSGSWCTKCVDGTRTWYFMSKPFSANGALHLLAGANMRDKIDLYRNATHIISFHLDTETFSYTELPPHEGQQLFPLLVGDTFGVIISDNSHKYDIWVLAKQQHKQEILYSWTKCYSIYLPPCIFSYLKAHDGCGDGDVFFINDLKMGKLLVFTGPAWLRHQVECNNGKKMICWPGKMVANYMYPYVESLLLH